MPTWEMLLATKEVLVNQLGVGKIVRICALFQFVPCQFVSKLQWSFRHLFSTCGRFHSTIDYVLLPNCWFEKISNAKTFFLSVDNTSDHVPIQVLSLGGEVQQFTDIMKIK